MVHRSTVKADNNQQLLANTQNNATIDASTIIKGNSAVHSIGHIDRDIYKVVTGNITTDEVIITDERIQHIKDRHPNDFEKYSGYLKEIVEHPQYIIESKKTEYGMDFERNNRR